MYRIVRFVVLVFVIGYCCDAHSQFCSKDWSIEGEYFDRAAGHLFTSKSAAWMFGDRAYWVMNASNKRWHHVYYIDAQRSCWTSSNPNIYAEESSVAFDQPNSLFVTSYVAPYNSSNGYYESGDSGGHWVFHKDVSLSPVGMTFVGNGVGFISRSSSPANPTLVTIWKTQSSGITWNQLNLSDTISSMNFINDSIGIVSAQGSRQATRTYITRNGGATWDTLRRRLFDKVRPNRLSCTLDLDHLWSIPSFLGVTDSIQYSEDLGESWKNIGSLAASGLFDFYYDSLLRVGTQGSISSRLASVKFYDSAFAVAVGTLGSVFITIDGGRHWQSQHVGILHRHPDGSSGPVERNYYSPVFDAFDFTDVWVIDHNNIVLFGEAPQHTSDGGQHWYYDYGSFFPTVATGSIAMLDTCRGWATASHRLLLSTTNGGNSWEGNQVDLERSTSAICLSFVGYRWGWVGYDHGGIGRTSNGGKSWTSCNLPLPYHVMSVKFIDSSHGFVEDNISSLWETTNGGESWVRRIKYWLPPDSVLLPEQNNNFPYYGLSFPTGLIGYYANDGGVYKTTDGGLNWTKLTFGINLSGSPLGCVFTNDNVGWLYTSGGPTNTFYKTTDGGASWKFFSDTCDVRIAADPNILWGKSLSLDGGKSWKKLGITQGTVAAAYQDRIAWAVENGGITRWSSNSDCCQCDWTGPEIDFSARSIIFDSVGSAGNRFDSLIIRNIGNRPLLIQSTSVEDHSINPQIVIGTISAQSIAPSDSIVVSLEVMPKTIGTEVALLSISSNDTLEPNAVIKIEGRVTGPVSVRTENLPGTESFQFEEIYPVPIQSGGTIVFSNNNRSGIPERIKLAVYDYLGRQVQILANDVFAPGLHSILCDASALANGTYFVRVASSAHFGTSLRMFVAH